MRLTLREKNNVPADVTRSALPPQLRIRSMIRGIELNGVVAVARGRIAQSVAARNVVCTRHLRWMHTHCSMQEILDFRNMSSSDQFPGWGPGGHRHAEIVF